MKKEPKDNLIDNQNVKMFVGESHTVQLHPEQEKFGQVLAPETPARATSQPRRILNLSQMTTIPKTQTTGTTNQYSP